MKAVVQRVSNASVTVNSKQTGSITYGLLAYIGVTHDDSVEDAEWLAQKIVHLRIFDDLDGKMNISLAEIVSRKKITENIGILAVSQFTLLGDCRKGRRPSWVNAAPPEKAKRLYEYFMEKVREQNILCESGEFQALMRVSYTNEGPVTLLLDSRENRN